ncbi:MAG: pentapeptide repeat-containing protein [Cyanobacteria bacterium P01_E01_bin.34]
MNMRTGLTRSWIAPRMAMAVGTGMVLGAGIAISLTLSARAETDAYEPFQALTTTGSCIECNLGHANLQGADLSYTNLQRTNLQGAKLYRGGPHPASLEGANLQGANLQLADLRKVNLRGANLAGADLTQANLYGSDLRGANLEGADLRGANLDRAQLFASSPGSNSALQSAISLEDASAIANSQGTVVAAGDILSLMLSANRDSKALAVQLEGALFDRSTQFPDGFDPEKAGMTFMP